MNSILRSSSIALVFANSVWILSGQVVSLADGTPVRLQLMQTISSADTHEGETIDFEVSEPVITQGLVAIPKGSVALGTVAKTEPKRRFGRSGELEISMDSVRLADGSRVPLRATREKGTGPLGGGRLAATIAVSPVLVWVKGKDVVFKKGTEATAYVNGDARLDELAIRRQSGAPAEEQIAAKTQGSAERSADANKALTNRDVIEMQKAGISEDVILTKIRNSSTDFKTNPQDLIQLKEGGVSDAVLSMIVEKSTGH